MNTIKGVKLNTPTLQTVKPVGGVNIKPAPVAAAPTPVNTVSVPPTPVQPVTNVKTVETEKTDEPKGGLFSQPTEPPKEETKAKEEVKDTKTKTDKSSKKNDKKEKEDKKNKKEDKQKGFTVPLHVFAYGEELFVIDNPKTTEEEIRQKAVNEFELFEMSKNRTEFIYNDKRDKLKICPSFKKKG